MKSKRLCQGYDPVFQSQGPHSIHPAPASAANNSHANHTTPTTSAVNNQSRRFTTTPISPPGSTHNINSSGIVNSSPRDHTEYPYPRPPEQLLPHLNQPYHMDGPSQTGLPYPPTGRRTYNFDIKSLISSH